MFNFFRPKPKIVVSPTDSPANGESSSVPLNSAASSSLANDVDAPSELSGEHSKLRTPSPEPEEIELLSSKDKLIPIKGESPGVSVFGSMAQMVAPVPLPSYAELTDEAEALLEISTKHTIVNDEDTVLVSLQPHSFKTRSPVRLVCCVDLSGSMGSAVSVSTRSGKRESHGLVLLDLVKHSLKTIVSSLGYVDSLAIVSFSDEAKIELELTPMSDSEIKSESRSENRKPNEKSPGNPRQDTFGKKAAYDAIDSLKIVRRTNIWAGLQLALSVMEKVSQDDGFVNAILLFTDGQPNIRPSGGEVAQLRSFLAQKFKSGFPIINTFGFGYTLDSTLLNDLATCGNGSFAFIPDALFVGTVFVDATANLFAAAAKSIKVKIEPLNGVQLVLKNDSTLLGNHHVVSGNAHSDYVLSFGGIQAGPQTKDIILKLQNLPASSNARDFLQITVEYSSTRKSKFNSQTVIVNSRHDGDTHAVHAQLARLLMVDRILEAWMLAAKSNFDGAESVLNLLVVDLKSIFTKLPAGKLKSNLRDLLVDVEGQAKEALTEEYFSKWGRHYLLSLANAHKQQQCNNFKDPGVQVYQSPLFEQLREDINEIFLKIPPPKPKTPSVSPASSSINASSTSRTYVAAPVDMARYNDSAGVCFSGECFVTLADKSTALVKSLKKGTKVLTKDERHAGKVYCMVVTQIANKPGTRLVCLKDSGLIITPFHPVKVASNSAWEFPVNRPDAQEYSNRSVTAIYSAILSEIECIDGESCNCGKKLQFGPSLFVNGVECAALGHEMGKEIFNESVIGHEYFGNRVKVLKDVTCGAGFEDGVVECDGVWRKDFGEIERIVVKT